jgi:Tripartite tricarboxylate transporter TctB family
MKFANNRDLWAGLMFIVVGAAAMFVASDYRFGSIRNMGSGFFPMVLGSLLIALGAYIAVRGLRSMEKIRSAIAVRPLILIPLSFVLFGKVMQATGFVPALVVIIILACAAGPEFKITETLLIATVLTIIAIAVFVWGLGLQFTLFGAS